MEIYECSECEDEVEFLEDGLCRQCFEEQEAEELDTESE